MAAVAQQRRSPLGLFPDKPTHRLYDRIVEVLRVRHSSLTFRRSFASHLLADGYDIRTARGLLGRCDVRATILYTHVLNRGGRGFRSPTDGLVCTLVGEPCAETANHALRGVAPKKPLTTYQLTPIDYLRTRLQTCGLQAIR
jgi:hypothetical protein